MRSETLEKFIKAFEDALNKGQGFQPASRDCSISVMKIFDEQCKGISSTIQFLECDIARLHIFMTI